MQTIKQAVIFAILMQNGQGIMSKSPDYVAEKLEAVSLEPEPEGLLDMGNQGLYHAWLRRWGEGG